MSSLLELSCKFFSSLPCVINGRQVLKNRSFGIDLKE